MNKTTSLILGAVLTTLADTSKYQSRSVEALAKASPNGTTEDAVRDVVAQYIDFFEIKEGRNGVLVTLDSDFKNNAAALGALFSALGNPNYQLRTAQAIATKAGLNERELSNLVDEEAYFYTKIRRSDGALLVGLAD